MPPLLLWIGRVFLVGLVVFAIYYPYKLLTSFVPFSFGGPESWQLHWMVEDHVLAPFWLRFTHFASWFPTMVATVIMLLAAIFLVVLLLRGAYFDFRTVKALQRVGFWAAIAGATAIFAMSFDGWLLTMMNDEYYRSITLRLESGEVGVFLVGLGLYLLARILLVATLKDKENREFV